MIKVKDGYAKLIGTTYQGSATQVLLSNGGDLEYSASSKASTLVQRNASQHIYATYFNSAISDEALTDIGSVYVRNTSDTFIRRVSKTQFYSILDDKFVTLDTTQSITGAKTFSTSVRFANNASIIQNQNDTSNYTTILKWYKNGASRNTYDPSIGQHNTGGDGNGSICILPYPTETSPWGGTVGLFISKGVLKLDGKSVALAENYYTKTESDERYVTLTTAQTVSGVKTFSTQQKFTVATGTSPFTVTSTTVVTNLNSDLLDGRHLGNATGRIPYIVSFPAYSSFGSSTSTLDYEKNILKWIWTNQNHGGDTLLIGVGRPNSIGNLQIQLYGTSGVNSSTGYPKYSSAIYYPLGGRPICFGTTDYNFYSYSLAFSDDIKDPANYYWANIKVSASSSTATEPTFNTCYTSNWFRSTGSTGWYSESYGGGWYMTDSTWIRTYGSKSVYQNTGQIRTDGYLVTNGGITVGATSPNNGTYKSHVTGNSWSSGYIRAGAGFYHNSVNSNSYVLLAGGSYKSLADFAKGNAGASNRGVYVTNGTVTAMTYYLNATVNSGASGKLAYYSGTNSIDDYTSTVGSSGTPIYLSSGVPTACTGVMVKYWASYTINNYSGTSVTYSKNGGNYNFVTSTSRRATGRYTIGTVYPSGQTWYTTLVWAVGNLNASNSSNSSNSLLYCTLIRGYNSGSTYYWYVNTADDASTNDGSFGLFFLCF